MMRVREVLRSKVYRIASHDDHKATFLWTGGRIQWNQHRMPRCFLGGRSSSSSSSRKSFGAFHFGTTEYAACFEGLPRPDPETFRQEALDYMEKNGRQQQEELWYKDPVCTILNGQKLSLDDHDDNNKNTGTVVVDTFSAFGKINGRQVLASPKQMKLIQDHIMSLSSSSSSSSDNKQFTTDLRDIIRSVEQDLLTNHGGDLIAWQCWDFGKQDGATELEEMVSNTIVERRLNDLLALEERRGRLIIPRLPIYVHCVSNFSNFLDLSRKILRSLELAIPVIILARTNHSQQHPYRYTQLLLHLLQQHQQQEQQQQLPDTDLSKLITFISCSLPDLQMLLQTCRVGNLYMTGSRSFAQQIKAIYPNTIASTGGPNTMLISTPHQANPQQPTTDDFEHDPTLIEEEEVVEDPDNPKQPPSLFHQSSAVHVQKTNHHDKPKQQQQQQQVTRVEEDWLTPELKAAIVTSAAIESAGQCTALRHVVVPMSKSSPSTLEQVSKILAEGVATMESSQVALKEGQFDRVFPHTTTSTTSQSMSAALSQYNHDARTDTYWKFNTSLPSPKAMPEFWRKVVLDYTTLPSEPWDFATMDRLAHWLNQTQPISLAVNGNMADSYRNMRRLFDRTALAVYTVGGKNAEIIPTNPLPKIFPPALTCQARPQDGEIFGEVPPRRDRSLYTLFPVYIPSSNPSYGATYQLDYLKQQPIGTLWNASSQKLLRAIQNDAIRGYCCLLIEYLRNIDDDNPKEVSMTWAKGRTVLWGVQRPPLQTITIVRAPQPDTPWDACAAAVMLFHVTNARPQIQLSVHPDNVKLADFARQHDLPVIMESSDQLTLRVEQDTALEEKSIIFQVVPAWEKTDSMTSFPMVGQFASIFFPMGHVKSTAPHDQEFLERFKHMSNKWIKTLF